MAAPATERAQAPRVTQPSSGKANRAVVAPATAAVVDVPSRGSRHIAILDGSVGAVAHDRRRRSFGWFWFVIVVALPVLLAGAWQGWDGVLARYKKNYPDRGAMGQLDFSELEFRFLGPDAALVLGEWHLKREKDDIGGVFTLVWQRFPDGWKIIHDHTSAVAPSKTSP